MTAPGNIGRSLRALLALTACGTALLRSETVSIPVPNGSFELPSTVFVSVDIDAWQKSPQPPDYDPREGPWVQKSGVFKNTAPGRPDHITNLDGNQALFLFAYPGAGLFMDATPPAGVFPVTYQAGDEFTLTVAASGGGGPMPEGARLQLQLAYLDDSNERHTVAATEVVHTSSQSVSITRLTDFTVVPPKVRAEDPWVGRRLSIGILSVGADAIGGYWDLDNVRLSVVRDASFQISVTAIPGGPRVSWPGAPGVTYRVELSPNLTSWEPVGSPQVGTGQELSQDVTASAAGPTFVRVSTVEVP